MRHLRHYPRFFENHDFSDYREPRMATPLLLCVAVIVTALVVFCMCKKMGVGGGGGGGGCGACASARIARNQDAHSDGVVHARDAAHLDELLATDGCVVLFHAPWCGHCAAMKPEYAAAAQAHPECLYVMVDCENAVGPEVLQKHRIEAFPTLRCYKRGSQHGEDYAGPREKEAMMAWAKQHAAQ